MAARGRAVVVAVNRSRARLLRWTFSGPTLGVLVTLLDGSHYAAIADDVADPDVAAALRHLIEGHARPGRPAICRGPACTGWQEWRPVVQVATSTA